MPCLLLFSVVGMLSLRSGLLLFHQGKSKNPSVANRGKPERRSKNSERIKIPACAGMTTVLETMPIHNAICIPL